MQMGIEQRVRLDGHMGIAVSFLCFSCGSCLFMRAKYRQ